MADLRIPRSRCGPWFAVLLVYADPCRSGASIGELGNPAERTGDADDVSQENLIARLAYIASIALEGAQAETALALARAGAKLERVAAMLINDDGLLCAVVQAVERSEGTFGTETHTRSLRNRYETLSNREREVMDLIAIRN